MESPADVLQVYRELAAIYERRGQAQMRDRFLVLAADAALTAGQADEAERLRDHLLRVNPHHMLKPYPSFKQGREAPDVDTYVRNLRLNYPLQVVRDLLASLQTSEAPPTKLPPKPLPSARRSAGFSAPAAEQAPEPTLAFPRKEPISAEGDEDDVQRTAALPLFDAPPARTPRKAGEPAKTALGPVPPPAHPSAPSKKEPGAADSGNQSGRKAAAPPPPAPRSAETARPAAPKAPSRPAPGPSPFAPFGSDPALPKVKATRPASLPEDGAANGNILASFLVVMVGLLGLVWVGFTFARPFIPDGWLFH